MRVCTEVGSGRPCALGREGQSERRNPARRLDYVLPGLARQNTIVSSIGGRLSLCALR